MNSLWDRIRQRKVVQWALAYLAGSWLVLQVLDVLGQNLGMPARVFRVPIALPWLEKAKEERDVNLVGLKEGPWYDPLRSDPEFQTLLNRMSFPEG